MVKEAFMNYRKHNIMFGIMAVTVLGITSIACDNNQEIKNYIVTFNADNGTENTSQIIAEGGMVIKPIDPAKENDIEGLFLNPILDYTFLGWFVHGTESVFDFCTPITTNIGLIARWAVPSTSPIDLSAWTGNIVEKAVAYVKSNAATDKDYTLAIASDYDVPPQILDVNHVKLAIVGIESERQIKLSSNGALFTIGKAISPNLMGVEFTLGNNITLVGRSSNNEAVILLVTNDFTMLPGSKIIGNTNIDVNPPSEGFGGGVITHLGIFTMLGGEISGNTALWGGGVCTGSGSAIFRMVSGTIYGSDETDTSLKNISTNDGASLVASGSAQWGGATQYGTFINGEWNGIDFDLNEGWYINDTIKVFNGVLQQ